jgi:hypothetical protein
MRNMTPEQMRQAERTTALVAVAHALTQAEREQLIAAAVRAVPEMKASRSAAEILDYTEDYDVFGGKNDPFLDRNEGQVPVVPGTRFAMDALSLLGRPLTVAAVTRLLVKAGIIDDDGYDPTRDLAVVLAVDSASTGNVRQPSPGYAQALANLRANLDMRAVETIEAGLRALYGKDA